MKGSKKTVRKGFTLIELLVVIAIIAILSVVVILTLNPAELLRQSRDSNRISDLSVMKSAVSFYMASVSSPILASSSPAYNEIYYSQLWVPTLPIASSGIASVAGANGTGSILRTVDSYGWIPINFNAITAGGSPIGNLPIDPVNATTSFDSYLNPLVYAYVATSSPNLSFKMTAHMESSKYGKNGSGDVVSTDGGVAPTVYEAGTNIAL